MAKILWPGGHSGVTLNPNVTRFFTFGAFVIQTSESVAQLVLRSAGTLSNLRVLVPANGFSASFTIRTRVNGGNGNLAISIASGTTGEFADDVNTDTVSAGEKWNLEFVTSAGGTTATVSIVETQFAASSNTVCVMTIVDGTALSNQNQTVYTPIPGRNWGNTTTESAAQVKYQTGGTLKNFEINIPTNTRTTTSTARIRKNGSNGNLAISITASTTGWLEDTSNTDTVSAADLICAAIDLGNDTNALGTNNAKVDFETTDATAVYGSAHRTGVVVNASATTYGGLGTGGFFNATETNVKATTNATFTASKLTCNISANTISGAGTVKFRKNGADGNQSVSITASTTGFFEDASHSDTVSTTDAVDIQVNGGAGGTSMTINSTSLKAAFLSGRVFKLAGEGGGLAGPLRGLVA